MIRAAIDSSKDHPAGITVVAGYIGNVDKWQAIDEPWNSRLALAGIDHFHLSEIKNRFGRDRWLDVVSPFAKIVGGSGLLAVSASLKDTDWAASDRDAAYRRICPHREHACLDMLWPILAHEQRTRYENAPVTIVFDNDWGNRSLIKRLHDDWCRRAGHPGFNIFMKGGVAWDSVPLQAADLFAGLLRQNPKFRDRLDDKWGPSGEITSLSRVAFRAAQTHHGTMWSDAVAKRTQQEIERLREKGVLK